MTRAALAVCALVLTAHVAHADDAWKATIECKTGKTRIRDARWLTLTKPLECSIRVLAHGKLDGATAEIWVRSLPDASHLPATLRVEGTRKPTVSFQLAQPLRRGYDYKGCGPFIVAARIDAEGGGWYDELEVFARCGKPKKLKAAFACIPEGCTLSVDAKHVKPGERLFAYFGVDEPRDRHEMIAKDGVFTLDKRVFVKGVPDCSVTTVKGAILDGDDQVRWEGTFTVDEECFGREFP